MLELVLGGELFSLLCKFEYGLAESDAVFYAACVSAALCYLHDLKIAYRDLKPENLLLDDKGYIKVADFGFATSLVKQDTTWTVCGTPEYMAPEIVANKGHGLPVDWWALGILIFEMILGHTPFRPREPMDTFRQIIAGKYVFPKSTPSRKGKDFVAGLLTNDPALRFGACPSDVLNSPFFGDLNWKKLEAGEVRAPHRPVIRDKFDASNFDTFEDDGMGEKWAAINREHGKEQFWKDFV